MTTKKRLHDLVDELPEHRVSFAEALLRALRGTGAVDPVLKALLEASPDEEPYTDEERAAVAAAWEDIRAGRVTSLAEVKRELEL